MTPVISTALMGLLVWAPVSLGTTTPAILGPSYSVSMTGYNAVPAQTDGNPDVTASGAYSNPDIVAARSVDLADKLPFGTVIEITAATSTPECGIDLVDHQIGLRVIADSMHPRMHNKIDILFDQTDQVRVGGKLTNPARVLGNCKNIEIRVVGKVDIQHMPKTQQELRLAVVPDTTTEQKFATK
jgi:3D (Asp-Asp-Asp) domain-containing protein